MLGALRAAIIYVVGWFKNVGGTPKLDPLGNRGNLISLGILYRLGVEHGPRKWLYLDGEMITIVFKTNPREFLLKCFMFFFGREPAIINKSLSKWAFLPT